MFSQGVELLVATANVTLGVVLLRKGQRLSMQFTLSPQFLTRETRFCYLAGLVALILALTLLMVIGLKALRLLN